MSLITKGLQVFKDDGVAAFCRRAAVHVSESLLAMNSANWYRADLGCPPVRIEVQDNCAIRFDATSETINWLFELRCEFPFAWNQRELMSATRHGHFYPLLKVDGRNAGYVKIGLAKAYVADFKSEIALPRGSAFIYDTFIHPEFRSCGLARFMISSVLRHLQSIDHDTVWCHIPAWNSPSARAFETNGFCKIARVRFVRVGRWRIYVPHPEKLIRANAFAPDNCQFRSNPLCDTR